MANETKNIVWSINDRVEAQLEDDYPIDYGAGFDSTEHERWIEPRWLGFTSQPTRKAERHERHLVNFNVYAKVNATGGSMYDVPAMVDAVRAAFDQHDLAVKDIDDAAETVLYYLRFEEANVTPVPAGGGRTSDAPNLAQVNISFLAVVIE